MRFFFVQYNRLFVVIFGRCAVHAWSVVDEVVGGSARQCVFVSARARALTHGTRFIVVVVLYSYGERTAAFSLGVRDTEIIPTARHGRDKCKMIVAPTLMELENKRIKTVFETFSVRIVFLAIVNLNCFKYAACLFWKF